MGSTARVIVAAVRALVLVSLALAARAATATADVEQDTPAGDARPGHAIGPIVLVGSGEVPSQFVDKLRIEAQAALESTEARTVPREAVAAILRSIPELATCATRECTARLALATAASRILSTRISVTGELFDITVELVDEQGRPLRQRATRCVACTLNDAIARTATAIRSLAGEERDDEVPVTIRSRPADATVSIDGREVGRAPWAGALRAGPHQLAVTGRRTVVRDLFVEAGAPLQLTLDVGGSRRFGGLTYGAAGVGAAAVIGGVALLALDGDGTCGQPSCPQVYETTAAGFGLAAVGVAALGAAGWMWWHDRQAGAAAAVVPTDGGVAAVVAGRF